MYEDIVNPTMESHFCRLIGLIDEGGTLMAAFENAAPVAYLQGQPTNQWYGRPTLMPDGSLQTSYRVAVDTLAARHENLEARDIHPDETIKAMQLVKDR